MPLLFIGNSIIKSSVTCHIGKCSRYVSGRTYSASCHHFPCRLTIKVLTCGWQRKDVRTYASPDTDASSIVICPFTKA